MVAATQRKKIAKISAGRLIPRPFPRVLQNRKGVKPLRLTPICPPQISLNRTSNSPFNLPNRRYMIRLTRLNLVPLVVNSDLIEHIEMTPDTVIVLTTGQKFMVRESPDEIIQRVVEFRQAVLSGMPAYVWPPREHSPAVSAPKPIRQVLNGE